MADQTKRKRLTAPNAVADAGIDMSGNFTKENKNGKNGQAEG
jgi:hypothetical protein